MLDRFVATLSEIEGRSLRFSASWPEYVRLAEDVTASYEALSEPDRELARGLATPQLGMKLVLLSRFLAEEAINSADPKFIRHGVLLHVIEGFASDPRENDRFLAILYAACTQIDHDFQAICRSCSALGSVEARDRLLAFAGRDPSLNRLPAYGLKLEHANGRFIFAPSA